jgi:hypothetical protein
MSRIYRSLIVVILLVIAFAGARTGALATPVSQSPTPTSTPTGYITVKEALDRGLIQLTLTANGEVFYHNPVHYIIKNLSSNPLLVYFPVGQIFDAADAAKQSLLLLRDIYVSIAFGQNGPNQAVAINMSLQTNQIVEGDLPVVCINESRHAPSKGDNYSLGSMAEGDLLALAKTIQTNSAQGHLGAQLAAWAITDNFQLNDINATPDPSQPSLADTIRPALCLAQDDVNLGERLLQEAKAGASLYTGENPLTSYCQSQGIPSISQIIQRLKVWGIEASLVVGAGALGCVAVLVGLIILIVRLARKPK